MPQLIKDWGLFDVQLKVYHVLTHSRHHKMTLSAPVNTVFSHVKKIL